MRMMRTVALTAANAAAIAICLATADAATWGPAASMNIGRTRHTATVLSTGAVLVTGGLTGAVDSLTVTGSAELYEPAVGTWSLTAALHTARSRHTATLLPNGLVLVAGGRTATGFATSSAELYDPATRQWLLTGSMNVPRDSHTATLLFDGRLLVAGGLSGGDGPDNPVEKTAEVYDYRTGTWSLTDAMSIARFGHSSSLLTDGRVLVAGGAGPRGDGVYTRTATLYDPTANAWRPVVPMLSERANHVAERLADGSLLVAGGYTLPANEVNKTASSERWVPALARWVPAGEMTLARAAFAGTLLPDGRYLVSGGRTATAELYDPSSGTWSSTASMSESRNWHRLVLLFNGRVLACGGENASGGLSSAELYMP